MKHRLSQGDDGKVVAARIGDEVEVCLPEKPSGGYRWLPADIAGHVEPAEQDVSFSPGMVGATSTARFTFRIKSAGRGALKLRYGRPWESDDAALETWSVTIESEANGR